MTSLYNIDYLKHLCQKYGLIPSRKYGQNFLINEEPIVAMLEAGEIKKDDVVVEVGPGFGVLTLALAEKAKKIMAFEIEKKLTTYWDGVLGRHPEYPSGHKLREGSLSPNERDSSSKTQNDKYKNIEIVWGNVLTSLSLRGAKSDEVPTAVADPRFSGIGTIPSLGDRHASLAMTGPYKVIANVPYQITSNIIRKFLEAENKPEVMVLMVQKEVAERICAKPGDMSVLAVSVQYYAEPEIVIQVPKSYFWPVPAVDSAIIKLSLRGAKSDEAIPLFGSATSGIAASPRSGVVPRNDSEKFFKIVKAGFANRRKMLIKNLSSLIDKKALHSIFKELGINDKVRAQELSVEQWQELAKSIT